MLTRAIGEYGEVREVEGDEDVVSEIVVREMKSGLEKAVTARFRFRDHKSTVFSLGFFYMVPPPLCVCVCGHLFIGGKLSSFPIT